MVHIFGVFGQHAALEQDSDKMTPRLRSILVQAMNGSTLASFMPAVGEGVGAEASSVLSSGNLYGLKERAVALESLSCIADELMGLKPGLKQALPHKEEQKIGAFLWSDDQQRRRSEGARISSCHRFASQFILGSRDYRRQ